MSAASPAWGDSRYDVRIGRGVMEKWTDVVRRVARIYCINQFKMLTRGRGVNKSKNFADIISGNPQACLAGPLGLRAWDVISVPGRIAAT